MLSLKPSLDIGPFVRASVSEGDDGIGKEFLNIIWFIVMPCNVMQQTPCHTLYFSSSYLRNGAYEVAGRGNIDEVFLGDLFGLEGWRRVVYDFSTVTIIFAAAVIVIAVFASASR